MLSTFSRPAPEPSRAHPGGVQTCRRRLWVAAALLCLAAGLRLVALDGVPPGLQHDEVFKTVFVEQVRSGQYPVFFDLNGGNEPFFAYLVTATLALFGENLLALRLPAVAGGLIGIAALWSLARRLWGQAAATVAVFLAAVSLWHLMDSRVSLRAIWLPAFLTVAYYLLWRGLEEGRRLWYAVGGVALGLSLYTYSSSALGVATVVLFGFWMLARGERRAAAGLLAASALALVLGAPLALHWAKVPEAGVRVQDLSYELTALRAGDPLPVLRSALRVAGMFAFVGDPEWRYNVAGRPVFCLPIGLACYFGLWLCWRRRDQPQFAFLAIWAVVNLAASAVTGSSPSTLRAVGAMPAVYVLAALGALEALRGVSGPAGRRLASVALVAALALEAGMALYGYFLVWPAHPEVRDVYRADLADIARHLRRSGETGPALVSSEYAADLDRLSFEYLGFTEIRPRYFDGSTSLLLPAEKTSVFVPASRPLAEPLIRVLAGRAELQHEASSFQAWTVEPGSSSTVAWLAEVQAPWPGPALQVLAVELPDAVRAGKSLEVVVHYRVSAPAPGGHAVTVFAHLRDEAGFLWSQSDALTYPTSDWRLGDEAYQLISLALPADMPDQAATVEVGFYEDAAQPYALQIGPERLAFTRLKAGEVSIEGSGAPLDSVVAQAVFVGPGPLVGATVAPTVVQPGQDIEVSLWWEGVDLGDFSGAEAVLTQAGEARSLRTQAISGDGTSTPGSALRLRMRFAVPADTPRGEWDLTLRVGRTAKEVALGRVFVGGVERTLEIPERPVTVRVELGGRATLLGLTETIAPARRGQTIDLELVWQALAPFDRNLTVFVHLTDGEGRVWAAHDGVPAAGVRPTRGWLTGEVIRDPHPIAVPTDVAPGRYRLIAGMYDSDRIGYPRLLVTGASTVAGADWALITELEVLE